MAGDLSYDLHVLTARLDRSADRILTAELGLSYRRFRALMVVGELGEATQRQLAEALGVTEPSVSRMAGVLATARMIDADADPTGGNRRRLILTVRGKEAVEQGRALLEQRFTALVDRSGVPHAEYAAHTRALIAALTPPDSKERP